MTGEFYTKKDLFPGFGRPFVFNAEIMLKLVEKNPFPDLEMRTAL